MKSSNLMLAIVFAVAAVIWLVQGILDLTHGGDRNTILLHFACFLIFAFGAFMLFRDYKNDKKH